MDIILKQDLLDIENVQQITSIETLIQLLKKRVGSPVGYSSLARDLQCSDKTIKRWLTILENMYIIFKVVPYHRNIARSILKAPKYYFYDTGQVVGDFGVKLENLVACSLLKEIDFFVTKNDTPSVDGRSKMGGRKGEFEFYSFREVFPWG